MPLNIALPIQTRALQAFVSEPVKPILDTVLSHLGTGTYLKGRADIRGGLDSVPVHEKSDNLPMQENLLLGLSEMFPAIGQLKLLRQGSGQLRGFQRHP